MRRYRLERSIIMNKRVEKPDKSVLDAALAEMPRKKSFLNKHTAIGAIAAAVCSCAAIFAVVICLPYFQFMQSGDIQFKPDELLTATETTVEQYESEYGVDLKTLSGDSRSCVLYTYEDESYYLEESAVCGGYEVWTLIRLITAPGIIFDIQRPYYDSLGGYREIIVGALSINCKIAETGMYAYFEDGERLYFFIVEGYSLAPESFFEKYLS